MGTAQSAAVMVLDHYPDADEIEELAIQHLEEFSDDDGSASAHVEVVYKAPEWMDVSEQDQINAFMRDGVKGTCVLVVYMSEEDFSDDELD